MQTKLIDPLQNKKFIPSLTHLLDLKKNIKFEDSMLNLFKSKIRPLKRTLSEIKYEVELNDFVNRISSTGKVVTPEMLGVLEWPYINNEWDVPTKLNTIAQHYEVINKLAPNLFVLNESSYVELLNLDSISSGVSIRIDHPHWFIREGELVVNIFKDGLRVASIAFTLACDVNIETVAYVGAIQGIHNGVDSEQSLRIYKELTKDFYGLRPKSLLLKVFQVIAKKLDVKQIFCIADEHRHHRHSFFEKNKVIELKTNYNDLWEEHLGQLDVKMGFYKIPLGSMIKDLSDVPSKKRAKYRRRNDFLRTLETTLNIN